MKNQTPINSNDFLEEKTKARPANHGLFFRRTLEVAFFAAVFGLIACFTMIVLSPLLQEKLYPAPVNEVTLTEESVPYTSEEIRPEDMLQEEKYEPGTSEEVTNTEEQLLNLAYILRKSAISCENWLVQVAGVSSEISWLESTNTSANIAAGAIIADNGVELLILAEKKYLQDADRIEVTFGDGSVLQGSMKGKDAYSRYTVVAVAKEQLSQEVLATYQLAELASSNNKGLLGSVVLALGNINGTPGNVGYGFITAVGVEAHNWDSTLRLLKTDIYGTSSPNGFLVNLKGQIVGLLCNDYNSTDVKNLISAVGISDLKKKIELISNNEIVPVLGIKGVDVTQKAHIEHNIPYGAYVTNVKLNSTAMKAGIQAGDIIVKLGEKEINSMFDFSYQLHQLHAENMISVVIMRQSQGVYRESTLRLVLGSE